MQFFKARGEALLDNFLFYVVVAVVVAVIVMYPFTPLP